MNLLVLGGGAREHAIAWRLAADGGDARLYCAPGNAGIAALATLVPLDPADPAEVLAFVRQHDIDLTVVGPELPLTKGVVDLLASDGHLVFGPSKAAAAIESSKVFAKEFMQRHHVPTAACVICANAEDARRTVLSGRFGFPLVVKADGLAAGKGVIVAPDSSSAVAAIDAIMVARQFGPAGDRVIIEECLEGPEVSFFVIADGMRTVGFGSAQDHKRALDGDCGPNTGGMGAFAPSPLVDERMAARIQTEVIDPTIGGLRDEGRPFRGFLYAGLMLTADGPKVLEFNARLGDPEAQVVLPMLAEDLTPVLMEAAAGDLRRCSCRFAADALVGVVLASGGYPERYETGKPIVGLEQATSRQGVLVFHAGTARRNAEVVTAGGRVLTVVGRGADHRAAMTCAYGGASRISFDGMFYRRDIGEKAIRENRSRPTERS